MGNRIPAHALHNSRPSPLVRAKHPLDPKQNRRQPMRNIRNHRHRRIPTYPSTYTYWLHKRLASPNKAANGYTYTTRLDLGGPLRVCLSPSCAGEAPPRAFLFSRPERTRRYIMREARGSFYKSARRRESRTLRGGGEQE